MSRSAAARQEARTAEVIKPEQLVTTPALQRPRGLAERADQSRVKHLQVEHIKRELLQDRFEVAVQGEELMRLWWPNLPEKHQRARMKARHADALSRIETAFDASVMRTKINVRLETIQRLNMRSGHHKMVINAARLQAQLAGIQPAPTAMHQHFERHETVQQTQLVQNTVQVVERDGQQITYDSAVQAMFRGIPGQEPAALPEKKDPE